MTTRAANIGIAFKLPECGFSAPAGQAFNNWQVSSASYSAGTSIAFAGATTISANWYSAPASKWHDNNKESWTEANAEGWLGNNN